MKELPQTLESGGLAGGQVSMSGTASFKAAKNPISLRLDIDVLDWLRRQGPGYQTTINRILREHMEAER